MFPLLRLPTAPFRKKGRRLMMLTLLLGFASYAWYHGFVPLFDGPNKARVRHALHLRMIPFGTSITGSGVDNWTDYIFEAELAIDPKRFRELLSGRPFKRQSMEGLLKPEITYATYIENYQGFEASEIWAWEDVPPNLRPGDYGTHCKVYFNAAHDRVFIDYTAD